VTEFKVPELGENVAGGDVMRVMVNVGDTVARDQPILELETDKATIEVPSTVTGTVKEVRVKKGDKIKVGAVVLTVDDGAAGGNGAPAQKAAKDPAAKAEEKPAPPTQKTEPAPADHDRHHDGDRRDDEHGQVHREVRRHHREHTADRSRVLLFAVRDGVTRELAHAEGENGEVRPAQVEDRQAGEPRECGGDQRAAGDHHRPRRGRDRPRAHVGPESEERGGAQRDIARRAGEHRPARRQRDVHETRERQ